MFERHTVYRQRSAAASSLRTNTEPSGTAGLCPFAMAACACCLTIAFRTIAADCCCIRQITSNTFNQGMFMLKNAILRHIRELILLLTIAATATGFVVTHRYVKKVQHDAGISDAQVDQARRNQWARCSPGFAPMSSDYCVGPKGMLSRTRTPLPSDESSQ